MSPARSKQQAVRQQHKRDRSDIVIAVAVAAGIVLVTLLLVWLVRPGPAGVPATGGLMNRQPRASWLIGIGIGVAGLATWWILTRSKPKTRERAKVILPITLGIVLVVSVVGGIFWPGGLLRHDVAPQAEPPPTTTPTTTPAAATTTVPSATTTTAPAATTTGAPTTTAAANASTTTSASP